MLKTRLAIAVFCVLVVCCALWAMTRPGSSGRTVPEPPLTADSGKRQNLLVGTRSCAECHPHNAALWAKSGHAHTFQRTTESAIAKRLDGRVFDDPERKKKFFYHFGADGLSVTLPSVFGEDPFPLAYALGSGTHGVTFLSLIPNDKGETIGIEHRATFFHSKDGLGITPGQRGLPLPAQEVEHFGKIVGSRVVSKCIGCHTTSGRIEREQIVNLRSNVGCESCHGPGQKHVEAIQNDGMDLQWPVKTRWPTADDEIRTCGECHRLPKMLKETALRRESVALVRLQPVGLLQSVCYRKSQGGLRCTTCHNPHTPVSKNRAHYEQVCRNCHTQPESTSCPVNAQRNCLQCHMPGIALATSVFHDHWIRIRTDADPAPARVESTRSEKN